MVLFKGQRKILALTDGSEVYMTPKGCMTTEVFVKWLDHFTKLIFLGASCYLDISSVDKAQQLGIDLLCIPNSTHICTAAYGQGRFPIVRALLRNTG